MSYLKFRQLGKLDKEKHPEDYCKVLNCLWRNTTLTGEYAPCPKLGHEKYNQQLINCEVTYKGLGKCD